MGRTLSAGVSSPLRAQKVLGLFATERPADLHDLAELLASGAISPLIGRRLPLENAAGAIRSLAAGDVTGKAVLTVP